MWKWTLEDDNVWKWRRCLPCPYTECACHRPRFSAQTLESRDFMHETHFFSGLATSDCPAECCYPRQPNDSQKNTAQKHINVSLFVMFSSPRVKTGVKGGDPPSLSLSLSLSTMLSLACTQIFFTRLVIRDKELFCSKMFDSLIHWDTALP